MIFKYSHFVIGLAMASVIIGVGSSVSLGDEAQRLRELGAQVDAEAVARIPNTLRSPDALHLVCSCKPAKENRDHPIESVVIGSDWKGKREDLELLPHIRGLKAIIFSHHDVDDDYLKIIDQLPDLEELYVYLPFLTDKSLKRIATLKKLRVLTLNGSALTDDGLALLKDLPKLEWLSFSGGSRIEGKFLEHGGFKSLWSFETTAQLPQDAVDALENFPIEHLVLSIGMNYDPDWSKIATLKKLVHLDLSWQQMTSKGLATLRNDRKITSSE